MTKNEFLVLLEKFHQQQLSPVEIDTLLEAAKEPEFELLLTAELQQELLQFNAAADAGEDKAEKVWSKVRAVIQEEAEDHRLLPNTRKRIYPLRKWMWTAASVIALLGVGIYFLYSKKDPETVIVKSKPKNDVPAGKNGAILTLADGKQLVLDSAGNGLIATQNGAKVLLRNNEISYAPGENQAAPVVYNTLETPNGRQFHVTLPDGTGVWLNAASSIRYPTTFSGKERKVNITGEVYFEVAKNQHLPFVVEVDGRMDVQVLGTSFNVNAYSDEPFISTTLLEGSIRIVGEPALTSGILKPGQQAQTSISGTKIFDAADLKMTTAWKEGSFQFNYTPLREILRQFARWYNVEVVYEPNAPNFEVIGSTKRDYSLSEALKTLELMGLHYRIEGRKLIIMP